MTGAGGWLVWWGRLSWWPGRSSGTGHYVIMTLDVVFRKCPPKSEMYVLFQFILMPLKWNEKDKCHNNKSFVLFNITLFPHNALFGVIGERGVEPCHRDQASTQYTQISTCTEGYKVNLGDLDTTLTQIKQGSQLTMAAQTQSKPRHVVSVLPDW